MQGEHTFYERLNGADLYFERPNPTGIGTPLVFLHGGPGYNSASFQNLFADKLAERTFIYLDQRGCGRSGPLADSEQGNETLDLDTLAADVEAIRQYFNYEQIVPLGHGFGALIALEYARRYPQHTERVILVNPWVHFPDLALTLLAEASHLSGKAFEDPAEQVRADTPAEKHPPIGSARIAKAFDLMNARDLLNSLHFIDSATRMRLEFIDTTEQLWASGEMQEALINQGLWEFEYPTFLQEITRPIDIIVGKQDSTSFPVQTQWVQDLGNADISVILQAAHYPWLDDEEEFATLLEESLVR